MKALRVVLALLVLSVASTSIAATHYIKADGTGDYTTIQDGITASVAGDTVLLAAGTYTGVGNRDIDFLGKAITVTSESGPDVTIIDCETLGRGFYFHNGESEDAFVSGFTITNGRVRDQGGGIYCINSSPTIIDCIIINNIATSKIKYCRNTRNSNNSAKYFCFINWNSMCCCPKKSLE